ncbi:hypothetical protein [Plantactinospora sp. BC1]|uniref:hypothetical protein n=1 Tax=Plantactinospora sp. BC1 TaxID=2108470 RepID=UPI001F3EB1E7|nr:hypothetical protein [Plantactinospora sp. BC1]
MEQIVPFVALAGALAVVLGGLRWLAARTRRRGVGRAVLGPLDEVYNPAAHRSQIEIQVQAERQAPAPIPGDRPRRGGAGGLAGGPGLAANR